MHLRVLLRDSMKSQHKVGISVNLLKVVEISGIEPLTSCLQGRRSPSWAKPPDLSLTLFCVVGQNGLAFLRKSHAGYNMPLACCQEPAFESWLPVPSHSYLLLSEASGFKWWAKMDSNHRPHDYQSCALASWAIGPYLRLHIFLGTSFAVPSKLNNASSQNTLYWP